MEGSARSPLTSPWHPHFSETAAGGRSDARRLGSAERARPPRAPRNLTPPSNVGSGNRSDKPTWRCQQIPLIGALGIQVICYPRRAFQERLINDRKERMINPWKLARAGIARAPLTFQELLGGMRASPPFHGYSSW